MANRIQELIVLLEEEIEQSPRQRLAGGNKRLVDCDRMLDLLGDLKVVVPEEVRQAQTVLLEQKAILRDAESQATEMLARARLESERLIAKENVLTEAKERGEAILRETEEKADGLMQESRDYFQTVMEEVQRYLTRYIEMIDETREDIRRNYCGAPKRFYTQNDRKENTEPMRIRYDAPAGGGMKEDTPEMVQESEKEAEKETTKAGIRSMPDIPKHETVILDEELLRRLE